MEKIDGLDIAKGEIRKYVEKLKDLPIDWAVSNPQLGVNPDDFAWELECIILAMLQQAVNEMIAEMHEARALAEWAKWHKSQQGGERLMW